MKATKYMFDLRMEALHKDSLRGMLAKALESLDNEMADLYVRYEDGDTLHYVTVTKEVEF